MSLSILRSLVTDRTTNGSLYPRYEKEGMTFLWRHITGDEVCIYLYMSKSKHKSSIWKFADEANPKKATVWKRKLINREILLSILSLYFRLSKYISAIISIRKEMNCMYIGFCIMIMPPASPPSLSNILHSQT